LRLATLCFFLVATRPASAAGSVQDLETLRRLAVEYAEEHTRELPGRVVIEAGAMDGRLRLPACRALERFLPPGVKLWGRAQVGMRCTDPESWTVMIPLNVQVWGPAVYAARPLAAGRPLSAEDLQVRESDLTRFPSGVVTDPAAALGRLPRMGVGAGLALRADMLRNPAVVQAGSQVSVFFRGEGLVVRGEGKAMGSAGVGETVQVRIPSGRLVRATVTGPGEVEVR
jgi:flagella basal body P-ring formation protein FlgA